MIVFKQGNLLTEDAEALVNTVNCVGVMGRGVALQFKNVYPSNFTAYELACKQGVVRPGRMFVYETGQLVNPKFIVNFPTKRDWRGKSRMEDIEAGLAALVTEIEARGIRSIALPPLGSGLGGLDWATVRPLIVGTLSKINNLNVVIFEPGDNAGDLRPNMSTQAPKMTAGRALLVTMINRYLAGLLDPFVTLLEVHKLMYFLQVAGQPLKLNYVKHKYGPYAENLRHVLKSIEGHMVTGYSDGGDYPTKPLQLVPGALEDATAYLDGKEDLQRLDRVCKLVDGFETPTGLELLATVHWVVAEQGASNISAVVHAVHAWNTRKTQFTEYQIDLALRVLARHNFVDKQILA